MEVRRTRLPLPTPQMRYGVPCAPLAVALVHELRLERDYRELVVMIEMALLAGVVTREEIREVLESTRRMHTRHFDALELATGECRSPPEVRMMLTWLLDARFGKPLMNREVLDLDGRLLGVVDLLDVESGSYGEYDGEAIEVARGIGGTWSEPRRSATSGWRGSRSWRVTRATYRCNAWPPLAGVHCGCRSVSARGASVPMCR